MKKSESTGERKRVEHCTVYDGSWNRSFIEKFLIVNWKKSKICENNLPFYYILTFLKLKCWCGYSVCYGRKFEDFKALLIWKQFRHMQKVWFLISFTIIMHLTLGFDYNWSHEKRIIMLNEIQSQAFCLLHVVTHILHVALYSYSVSFSLLHYFM